MFILVYIMMGMILSVLWLTIFVYMHFGISYFLFYQHVFLMIFVYSHVTTIHKIVIGEVRSTILDQKLAQKS